MANSAYRFSLASDSVAGMAKILQTLESKEHALKAGELAVYVQFGLQARPVRIVRPLKLLYKGAYKNACKSLPVTLSI